MIPQKSNEKRAYEVLNKRIINLVSKTYHLSVFCDEICNIDRENNQITISTVYVLNSESGKENPWLEKVIVDNLAAGIDNAKKSLREDGYYMQLSFRIRKALQPLMDNQFPKHFASSLKHSPMIDDDLIRLYDDYQISVAQARKALKQNTERSMVPFTDTERIDEFEFKLSKVDPAFLKENPTFIPYMKIR